MIRTTASSAGAMPAPVLARPLSRGGCICIVVLVLLLGTAPVPVLGESFELKNPEPGNDADGFLEPEVHRYVNVLPRSVCEEIIRLGEEAGFPLESDSIDDCDPNDPLIVDDPAVECAPNNNSQAIDVMTEQGVVMYPDIFAQLEPYIPQMQDLIRSTRNETLDKQIFPDAPPNRVPKLGWIFYRKYAPDSARNSLVPHYDDNLFTVNVALNDDYTGGGIFYVKPSIANNPEYLASFTDDTIDSSYNTPELEAHQSTYEWVDALTKENSSDVVFPEMHTGDAMVYNYTVYHAVAPIETGTRYSMVLFFDMDNPMLQNEDDDDDDEISFQWEHAIVDCVDGRLVPIEDTIDVYWVDNDPDGVSMDLVSRALPPGRVEPTEDDPEGLFAVPGTMYRAFRSVPKGTRPTEPLATIVIEEGREFYRFESSAAPRACGVGGDEPDGGKIEDGPSKSFWEYYEDDEDDGEDTINARLEHAIRECDPATGNLAPIPDAINVYFMDAFDGSMERVKSGLSPGEIFVSDDYLDVAGNKYLAYRSGVDPVDGKPPLATVVIEAGREAYAFEGSVATQRDCDDLLPPRTTTTAAADGSLSSTTTRSAAAATS